MTQISAEQTDRDRKIFELFKQHHTPRDIAARLDLPAAQGIRAVKRLLNDQFSLDGPGKIRAALAIKEDHVRRLNQRLEQIQGGITEITHKESPRGSELSEAEKFYVSAEVSLLREIRATENEINELKGLLKLSRDDGGDDPPGVNVTIRLDADGDGSEEDEAGDGGREDL